jgi:hypothetical protein
LARHGLSLAPVVVLVVLVSAIDLPMTVYVLAGATLIPIGAIDMCHYEHCKGAVTDKPVGEGIQTVNRLAQRAGPILISVGFLLALVGIVAAVLASIC